MKILLDKPPIKRRTGMVIIVAIMLLQVTLLLRLAEGTLETIASIVLPIILMLGLMKAWGTLTKKYL
jgi:hypothetical protein